MGVWRKNAPRRRSNQCKGPEVEECLCVERTGRKSGGYHTVNQGKRYKNRA